MAYNGGHKDPRVSMAYKGGHKDPRASMACKVRVEEATQLVTQASEMGLVALITQGPADMVNMFGAESRTTYILHTDTQITPSPHHTTQRNTHNVPHDKHTNKQYTNK